METTRSLRRMAGLLAARLPELRLDQVADSRDRRGRRWKLAPLLTTALVTQLAGARSTADAEQLTARLSRVMRRRLGIARRVPDTTLRDTLCALAPDDLRAVLHRGVRAADRRKALTPHALPFGVVAMDGKWSALPTWDADFVQRRTTDDGHAFGMLRTITSCLVSARAAPCLDAFPVPRSTSEAGAFAAAFGELVRAHGHLFQLITYDAGAASGGNATTVVAAGKDYLFALKLDQPKKLDAARRLLADQPVVARTETVLSNRRSVVRTLRLARVKHLRGARSPIFWSTTHSIVEVTAESIVDGEVASRETRHFLSSLAHDAITPAHWLVVVRRHWGVENDCHKTFDVAFDEDDHPWIEMDPRGTLVVLLLRRIAYNLLALFRSVTQRSDERRTMPWRELMRWVEWALLAARDEQLAGLRAHQIVAFD